MDTKLAENEREQKVRWSESELAQQSAEAHRAAEMKRIEADVKTKQYEQELMTLAEKKRQEREIETLRATELTRTNLEAEQQIRKAEANASVIKTIAEAEASAVRMKADAELEKEKKRAEGIKIVLDAQADGLSTFTAKQQDPELVKFYLGLKDKLYTDIARTQADAFKDLKPQFHIWSTGPNANKDDPSAVITKTLQNMAPLFSGLQQSGIKIPFLTPVAENDLKNAVH